MNTIKILHLEVGYDSQDPDTLHSCTPPLKKILETHIGETHLGNWAKEVPHSFPTPPTDDTWVAAYLQQKFDDALGKDVVQIDEDCLWSIHGARPPLTKGARGRKPAWSGSHGTRCVLRGEIWVNIRTYALATPQGDKWPADREPKYATVFASLTWVCEQKSA